MIQKINCFYFLLHTYLICERKPFLLANKTKINIKFPSEYNK